MSGPHLSRDSGNGTTRRPGRPWSIARIACGALPLLGLGVTILVMTILVMLGVFGLLEAVAMAVGGLQVAFFVASILVVGHVGL